MSAPTRSATAFARSATTSDTTSFAPAPASRSQSGPPTAPAPSTTIVLPDGSSDPNARARPARIPWNTPIAVSGADVPEPPAATLRPITCGHRSPTTSMSASVVFMSHAVT